ncbi:hypothetical protein MRS44_005359 [Fusarium solani]|uniref:uncharacterized protein n=1 Tax=Fusarium solani TaxID=169388 RepID=UPI0032C3DB09|nr:hypothetical protein MRS44_005359 [Fusarium solani]
MSISPKPLTVFITGAAGGLGRVIATAFLDKGTNVAICDVNEERLAETTALWAQSYPDRFIAQQADVASLADIETLVQSITSKFGRLDILINNAAVLDKFDPAGTCSQEIGCQHHGGPVPPGGSIINMGSNASVSGTDGGLAYTVSKHGILALTRNTAAFYLDHDITCTMLQLGGLAATNIQDSLTEDVNMEGMGLIDKHMPGFQPGVNDVPLQDVAKFCILLTDRELAKTLNGASVPFNRNWPAGV